MKTTLAKVGVETDRNWRIVDASDKILGRLAVKVANALRGRDKPIFTPHIDAGDYVIVINAEKVKLSGKKEEQKQYMFYSGYMGGEKYRNVADFRAKRPEFLIMNAVKGMLPKNKLSSQFLKKLRIYVGPEHPHEAQSPQPLEIS
ncbi:MAG: 50S ribosomal protein L13 [Opitutales bacterium]|nr:50S ribosomal protein L13 [Opitutales bacterium]